MNSIEEKFLKLDDEFAPGQESKQKETNIQLPTELPFEKTNYSPIDFSHGNLEAFKPIPTAMEKFIEGFYVGGSKQAYTEYRGDAYLRSNVATKLSKFTNTYIDDDQLIITPGTQGALFLAMGSTVSKGDKVAIVEPDYFAYRKLVDFFEGEKIPIQMNYLTNESKTGLDLEELEDA